MLKPINTLHLWKILLNISETELPEMFSILNSEEQEHADRFLFEKHRRRYIVAHAKMRQIIAAQLKISASEVIFQTNENGKPYIPGLPLHFNLSHSEEMAIVAITATAEVGVDIEYVKNDIDALEIAERFFHRDEFAQLKKAPPEKYLHYFYTCWTGKEAYLKAKGHGITNYLNKFSLNIQDPKSIKIIFADKELDEFKSWFVRSFRLDPDYIVTVVCTEPNSDLEIHQA